MHRRLAALLAAAIVVLVLISALAAPRPQQDCTSGSCTYLPVLTKPLLPTATATPTLAPPPTATSTATTTPTQAPTNTPRPAPPPLTPCDQHAPPAAEGAQAWMTITDPPRFSMTTLCVRLIIGGQVVPGATISGVAHYKTTDTDLGPATTGADGVGHVTFSIGGASHGFTVIVDAKAVYGGQTYTVFTSFTPP